MKESSIGILGGTFNPVHMGHLIMAEVARQEFGLDKVIFIPTGNPPHKVDQQVISAEHRYTMTKMAIMDNPFFEVDNMEIIREGRTYTIDTLKELHARSEKKHKFYFIIGGDTLLEIKGWKQSKEVMRLCRFIVYQRPGYLRDDLYREAERLTSTLQASIHFVEGVPLDISSTQIRDRLYRGKTVRYLLPQEVETYIQNHSLYSGGE